LLIEKASKQTTESEKGSPLGSPNGSQEKPYGNKTRWLIAKDGNRQLEPLCVQAGAAKVLPVFSFEEEAEMFLRLAGYEGDGWQVRESCTGELISVLYGPCMSVRGVALDPLPEMLEGGTVGLVWVGRRHFLGQLMVREGERTAS